VVIFREVHIGVRTEKLMPKEATMFESSANPQIRQIMQNAHAERGKVSRSIWNWMFGGFSR